MARKSKEIELQEKYRRRSKQEIETLYATTELSSDDNSSSATDDLTDTANDKQLICKSKTKTSMKKDCASVITKDVAAALDRTKVTDRQAVHLLAATARGLGHNVSDLTLSRSSVQRQGSCCFILRAL